MGTDTDSKSARKIAKYYLPFFLCAFSKRFHRSDRIKPGSGGEFVDPVKLKAMPKIAGRGRIRAMVAG
jgi:hypothetical protein